MVCRNGGMSLSHPRKLSSQKTKSPPSYFQFCGIQQKNKIPNLFSSPPPLLHLLSFSMWGPPHAAQHLPKLAGPDPLPDHRTKLLGTCWHPWASAGPGIH